MKNLLLVVSILLSACAVEQIGPRGTTVTRPIRVKGHDVLVFGAIAEVSGRFTVVDDVWVKDDGDTLPSVLESRLRELAGARGANAVIMDPLNRKPNSLRIDLRPTLEKPFEYFSATPIWVGEGERPEKYLGTVERR